MTPEIERYYENRLDMMGSQAWRDLMDDVEGMLKSTDSLQGVTSENFRFRQGEVGMMNWMLSLRAISTTAYEELKDASDV